MGTKANGLAVIILAAGKGTRMKSDLPKILHPVAGLSLVGHLLKQVNALEPDRIIAVIGHDAARIEQEIHTHAPATQFVTQEPQLGTAHAVKTALPLLDNFQGTVLVVYADHPFISMLTLKNLCNSVVGRHAVAVLGFEPANPGMYGRLKTSKKGVLKGIVEYKDASEKERAIGLCNSGVMAFQGKWLKPLVEAVGNQNAANEFYLTDTIVLARRKGLSCTYSLAREAEVMGINSQAERSAAEHVAQQSLRERAMADGVLLVAPENRIF